MVSEQQVASRWEPRREWYHGAVEAGGLAGNYGMEAGGERGEGLALWDGQVPLMCVEMCWLHI